MFNWLNELLEIRYTYKRAKFEMEREKAVCRSCENLQIELAKAHELNHELLKNITTKPIVEQKIDMSALKPITPSRHLPFNVRRQMMETEDRRRAAILREQELENKKPVPDETKLPNTASTEVDSNLTAELELELDVAADERTAQSGVRNATGH
jgi:hypothetical protein